MGERRLRDGLEKLLQSNLREASIYIWTLSAEQMQINGMRYLPARAVSARASLVSRSVLPARLSMEIISEAPYAEKIDLLWVEGGLRLELAFGVVLAIVVEKSVEFGCR